MSTNRFPRGRWAYRVLGAASIAVASLLVLSSSVYAAPPSHDEIGGAIRFFRTPFRHTTNTTEATAAQSDPECGGATVWYRFRPRVNGTFVASTEGSDYDTTMAVLSGSPRSLTPLDCADDVYGSQAAVRFDVTRGTTYYIQVGTCCDGEPGRAGPGGKLVLTVGDPPPTPEVTVQVEAAQVIGLGRARVTGTVTCNQRLNGGLSGTLRQQQGLNLANATFAVALECSETPSPWTAIADNELRVFELREAEVRAVAQGCHPWECKEAEQQSTLTLTQ